VKNSPVKRFLVRSHYSLKGVLCGLAPSNLKMLPSFMIIGAQKGGTTAIYDYLIDHPQVLAPWFKEADFFNRRRMFSSLEDYSIEQYQSIFPLKVSQRLVQRHLSRHVITGEASQYLSYQEAPERILEALPDIKLIVLLRNPAMRAYSHYSMRRRYGWERQTFEESFFRENSSKGMSESSTYKFRGLYSTHLKWWFDCFSRDQFLILETDEVRENRSESYKLICDFLNIEKQFPNREITSNVGNYARPSSQDIELWQNFYRPHNEDLFSLIDKKFDWN